MNRIFTCLLFLFIAIHTFGQTVTDQRTDIAFIDVTLEQALFNLSKEVQVNIGFSPQIIPEKHIYALRFRNRTIGWILKELLHGTNLTYEVIGQQIVVVRKEISKKKYTISGIITDLESGERLIGAHIYHPQSQSGAATNEYGFYSITLTEGAYELVVSYLGYQSEKMRIGLYGDRRLDVALSPSSLPIITVKPNDSTLNAISLPIGLDIFSIEKIKALPNLGGEGDLFRSAHNLTGVQTGAEGVGGINVRGGSADQNLVLLDGVPVYNPSHTGGIYSIFNHSALNSAQLHKGNFPARYGGRLSSVIDVRTKDGNNKSFHTEGTLGMLAAKLSAEGPIIKDKASFFISARRTTADPWVKKLFQFINQEKGLEGFTTYNFRDINAKLNFDVGDRNRLYLGLYQGGDKFHDEFDNRISLEDERQVQERRRNIEWGNLISSFRWNSILSNQLFMNTTFTYSNYNFESFNESQDSLIDFQPRLVRRFFNRTEYISTIEDFAGKVDFDYIPNPTNRLRFGIHAIRHNFKPGVASIDQGSSVDTTIIGDSEISDLNIRAREYSAYIEDEIKVTPKFILNLGVHAAFFDVENSLYWDIQPRISSMLFLNDQLAFKSAFSTNTQFLHLLTNSGFNFPNDIWVPSTDDVSPQKSWQISTGITYEIEQGVNLNVEAYYKNLDDLITYSEGASFLIGSAALAGPLIDVINWEDRVTKGEGWSYGLEFLANKTYGRTTGSLAYTLSWAKRKFDRVNFGETFPFAYDRRINVKFVVNHKINRHLSFSLNWVYGSGNKITLPTSSFTHRLFPFSNDSNELTLFNFQSKNAFSMPDYHRMDVNIFYHIKTARLTHEINFGIYNLYNRSNPFNFVIRQDPFREKKLVKITLLPILPSLSYTVRM